MMERMGINMKEMPGVEEVIIRTAEKEIHIRNATVSEVNAQGNRVFQVVGEVEEVARETKTFSDADARPAAQPARAPPAQPPPAPPHAPRTPPPPAPPP